MASLDSIRARLAEAEECQAAGADAEALRALGLAWSDMLDLVGDTLVDEDLALPTALLRVVQGLREERHRAAALVGALGVAIRARQRVIEREAQS